MSGKFLTIEELCERYGFSRSTFYEIKKKYGTAKDFPKSYKFGRKVVLKSAECDEYFERIAER